MAGINTIDRHSTQIGQDNAAGHTHADTTTEQGIECSPLLRLPSKVRKMIWRHVFTDEKYIHLHYLEDITQVNRQLRAETLPICYEKPYMLEFWDDSPGDWVESVEEVIDGLSAKSGLPGFSPLHHLNGLSLQLRATDPEGYNIEIEFELRNNHEGITRESDGEEEELVVVGSPDMDWTDAKAVRAACDAAATQLESNRRKHIDEVEKEALEMESWTTPHRLWAKDYPAHYKAAVDALYALVSVCPRLTNITVLDESEEACVFDAPL